MPANDILNGAHLLKNAINPKWCKSGPNRISGDYLPNIQNTNQAHQIVPNNFAVWLRFGTPLPPNANMNCWEAIMYAAYAGGLVDRHRLEVAHRAAAQAARRAQINKDEVYLKFLMEAVFGYGDFVPRPNNINLPGDIIFVDGYMEPCKHVMLGCGGSWVWSHDMIDLYAPTDNFVRTDWIRYLYRPFLGNYTVRYIAFPF
jgi:hypothetical protein